MLPFLKNRKESSVAVTSDVQTRKPDEGSEPFDAIDAVAEDFLAAVKSADKSLLKGALQALIAFIQDSDEQQDKELKG